MNYIMKYCIFTKDSQNACLVKIWPLTKYLKVKIPKKNMAKFSLGPWSTSYGSLDGKIVPIDTVSQNRLRTIKKSKILQKMMQKNWNKICEKLFKTPLDSLEVTHKGNWYIIDDIGP